jgi:hypothetical protein
MKDDRGATFCRCSTSRFSIKFGEKIISPRRKNQDAAFLRDFSHIVYLGKMKLFVSLSLLLAVLSHDLAAQAPGKAPCDGQEFRQLDFWVGEWEVYAQDRLVGWSRVEPILGGCVLLENWTGKGGSEGKSFNRYDAQTKRWEQTWVDNAGLSLVFRGKYDATAQAMRFVADADSVQQRMTFYALPDGTVRQLWESAPPMGDFKTTFDGLYRRVAPTKED